MSRLHMENSANTSSKILSGVYAILAIFSALLLLQLLITNQAFVDFRGGVLFVVAAVTFLVTSVAVWVKWNDNYPYKHEAPYKISPGTAFFKAIFGSFAITVALFILCVVLGLYVLGVKTVDDIIEKYSVFIIIGCSILLFPFVKKFMK